MDIVDGECLSLAGFRYALLLVDVATRYCWVYGFPSLSLLHIVDALDAFHSDANGMLKKSTQTLTRNSLAAKP